MRRLGGALGIRDVVRRGFAASFQRSAFSTPHAPAALSMEPLTAARRRAFGSWLLAFGSHGAPAALHMESIQLLNQGREHAFRFMPQRRERNRRGWQGFSGLVMQAVLLLVSFSRSRRPRGRPLSPGSSGEAKDVLAKSGDARFCINCGADPLRS